MKPIELKKGNNAIEMPPVGHYIAEIRQARIAEANDKQRYDKLEMMLEITEGEYKGRFGEIFNDQTEKGYDNARWKGIFRLTLPTEGQENNDSIEQWVSKQLFCVFDSNAAPGGSKEYRWDGDPKVLVGKKVGITMRKRLYNYTNRNGENVDAETTEIGRLETVDDVQKGKCKLMRDNNRRTSESTSSNEPTFTEVSTEVSVPW